MRQKKGALTRLEISQRISLELGFSVRSSSKVVGSLFKVMEQALNSDEIVKIVRFGTFSPLLKKSRKGINPTTGKSILIPARKTVSFKPSPLLKKRVNAQKGPQILPDRSG